MAFSDLQTSSPMSILELKEFQKQSFVEFLKVRVGKSESAAITVKNPDSESAVSFFCLTPKFAQNPATFNGTIRSEKPFDHEITLPPDGDEILRFTWTPDKPGSIRELVEIRALVKETGRQFAVRVVLLGTCEARKKTAKVAPNRKKPVVLRQNPEIPSTANQERSDVTFAVPQRSVSTQGRNFVGAIGASQNAAALEFPAPDENFYAASSPEGRAAISTEITVSSSPRRETFVVETKTTTIMNTREVTMRSPVKGRNGQQFWEEEEISKTQTEETVVEERRTVEVQQTDRISTGGVKASASRTGAVYEGMDSVPASPLNSTVCPTGEDVSKKFFPDDVTLSAIGGNPRRRILVTPNGDALVGKLAKQLDYAEGGVFVKPFPPAGPRAPVKRLDLTALKEVQSSDTVDQQSDAATFNMESMKTGAGDCGPSLIAEKPINSVAPTQNPSVAGGNKTRPTLDHLLATSEQEEEWAKQQEKGFSVWLNCVLRASFDDEPDGELTVEESKVLTEDAGKKLLRKLESQGAALPAPSKECVSLKLYADLRNQTELRREGRRIWLELEPLILKFDKAVLDKKFYIRADKDIHADTGLRVLMLQVLSSIHPLWLRIGLETVFGETIGMKSPTDRMELLRFVTQRLLSDPETQKKWAHATVKSFIRKDESKAEMGRLFLRRYVHLIIFLDKAKGEGIIRHDPCLFVSSKHFKTIKDLFRVLISEFMSGDGNLLKFLSRNGYTPGHQQTDLDEYRYSVRHIGTDLRDGVILMKVVKQLTGAKENFQRILCPAVDINRKMHNMRLVFEALQKANFNLTGLKPKQIVEGSRDKTLEFLWRLVLQFQVRALFAVNDVAAEIDRLEKSLTAKERTEFNAVNYSQFESSETALLFRWARVVCLKRGVNIRNFGSSFEDGRAMCALVGFYSVPSVTVIDDSQFDEPANRWESFFGAMKEIGGVPQLIGAPSTEGGGLCEKMTILCLSILCERLLVLQKETRAALIIQGAWKKRQFRKTLESALKLRRVVGNVQTRWRATLAMRYQRKAFLIRLEQQRNETRAAVAIQRYWRRTGRFMIFYQKLRIQIDLERCATKIQATWRGILVRRELKKMDGAARRITESVRAVGERRRFLALKRSAVLVAERRKSTLLMREDRRRFLEKLEEHGRRTLAACTIQRSWKGAGVFLCRLRRSLANHRKAIVLQALWRGHVARRNLNQQHAAATKLGAWWRMVHERRKFLLRKKAAIVLQKNVKMVVTRRRYLVMRDQRRQELRRERAATKVQSWLRMRKARAKFLTEKEDMRKNVIKERIRNMKSKKIQRWFRQIMADRRRRDAAATKVAAHMRMVRDRIRFLVLKAAVSVVVTRRMALLDMRRDRNAFLTLKRSVIGIQSVFRGNVQRKLFLEWKEEQTRLKQEASVIRIQTAWRGFLARKELEKLREARKQYLARVSENLRMNLAAIQIQKQARLFLVRLRAQKQMNSVIQIQTWWRCVVLRRQFLRLKKTVIALQSMYKSRLVFQQFLTCRTSAIKIQAAWRGYCTRKRDTDSGMRIRYVKERLQLMTNRADSREYLGNRTERALDIILNRRHLYSMRNALLELETTSRLSPDSCEKICQRGVVAAIFDLMREMNRGVAWHGISSVSAAILLNIAKFSKTAGYLLAQEFWAEMLVEHMVKNRPKLPGCDEETIFVHLATIFICLSHIPDAQFAIAQSKENKKKLDSLYTLLKKTHAKELLDKSQNLLKNQLDRVVALREVHKLERLDTKMLDVTRSPYDPQWVLRKERTAEDIKPLYAIKYLRMRYGLEAE